jgi:hypothetical protein
MDQIWNSPSFETLAALALRMRNSTNTRDDLTLRSPPRP